MNTSISQRLTAVEKTMNAGGGSESALRQVAAKFGLDLGRAEVKAVLEKAIREGEIDTRALTVTWPTYQEIYRLTRPIAK